jgi:uncharacterized protein YsxB (DUF464 family)
MKEETADILGRLLGITTEIVNAIEKISSLIETLQKQREKSELKLEKNKLIKMLKNDIKRLRKIQKKYVEIVKIAEKRDLKKTYSNLRGK